MMGVAPDPGSQARLDIGVCEEGLHTTITLTGELDCDKCPDVTRGTDTLVLQGSTLCTNFSGVCQPLC